MKTAEGKLFTAEQKIKRIQDFLDQIEHDIQVVANSLMAPENMHNGFFKLGLLISRLDCFMDEEFPNE